MIRLAIDFIFSPHRFYPTKIAKNFREVEEIVKSKADLILIDKDDTITAFRQFSIYNDAIRQSLKRMQQAQIQVKILSNGIKDGDPLFVEDIDIVRTRIKKPFNQEQVQQLIDSREKSRVWVVGDRLMTDIYLANSLGCTSILVNPIEKTSISKHGFMVWILRNVQNAWLLLHDPK